MRTRILLSLLGLILVPLATVAIILIARGYRPNVQTGQITSTGLLAATSLPNGAQIIVNGKLASATDTTLNLEPGTYTIEIKKDGFSPWQKKLEIQAEIVTRAAATLFPTVPSLKAITASGASRPIQSPDGSAVAFVQDQGNLSNVYTIDLSESPLGSINRNAKLVTSLPKDQYLLSWSPDSKEIMSLATPSAYLSILAEQRTTLASQSANIKQRWTTLQQTIDAPKLLALPIELRVLLAGSASDVVWSPRENKILYTATASATIPLGLIKPLPGSNSQPESRALESGKVYVYDLEEDKNFEVGQGKANAGLVWFPDSGHLVKVEPNKVTIMEYDGTNQTVVYAGPMVNGYAFPYPSGKQLLILTNLNAATSTLPNLYAVSLR